MKNDLTCGVVRDLLPSYVENLLGEESKEAVDRHLETCPECRERKEDMAAPTGAEETAVGRIYLAAGFELVRTIERDGRPSMLLYELTL